MAIQDSAFPLQDALFCDEPQWSNDDEVDETDDGAGRPSLVVVSEEDLRWDEEELAALLAKETKPQQAHMGLEEDVEVGVGFGFARREAVAWMMRVVARHCFSAATTVLAVDYFDRFMARQRDKPDKPWMVQLTAVTCLSLAAKVEETQAPLLLDLQVEGAKFVFEPKTIQSMELLVLLTLQWRMHPVTPLSFIDHVTRRLGLKPHLQVDFLNRCHRVLTSIIPDSSWALYPPSALASATMLHVIDLLDDEECCSDSIIEHQNQLFRALITINKDKVSECYKLIHDLNISCGHRKRKGSTLQILSGSPKAVIDAYLMVMSDSSNDSPLKRARFGSSQRLYLGINGNGSTTTGTSQFSS
uniref:Cyclin D3 n=1 Tax=Kalanchoe fedtschenkoi TaxID=63787 RepID=A0A7N1A9X7_KALFE